MHKLYIRQKVFKITDHYDIIDEHDQTVYKVDQAFHLFRHQVHVSTPTGDEIFKVVQVLWSFLPLYQVVFSDGRELSIKSQLSFFKRKIDVQMQNFQLHLTGAFWDDTFTIVNNDVTVAEIKKQWFTWGDTYEVTVYDHTMQDVVVALVIAVDHLKDKKQKRR